MPSATPPGSLRAVAFDAYGTLFDVFSVTSLCEQLFPARGDALAQLWRAKQLHYSLLHSVMGRYRDFWQITGDALDYAARNLALALTATREASSAASRFEANVQSVERDAAIGAGGRDTAIGLLAGLSFYTR